MINHITKNLRVKRYWVLTCFVLVFISSAQTQTQLQPSSQPSAAQQQQIARGYGMFIHFGVNTFNEKEWSDGTLPVSSFNPSKLDCDQWVKTAKEAGFRYVILITKHHDGFCLWNSKYTDYDVMSSPVKTDVVKAVAEACKKYGLQLGLYYSLWDRHEPTHNDKNPQVYVDFMKNQLTELLSNYGNIIEIWFDGGWAKKDDDWHIPEVYAHIKKLQPNCQVTVNHTIGTWGNMTKIRQPVEMQQGDPIRFFPVDFRTKDPNIARWDDPKLYKHNDQLYYLPFEHTLCLSDRWNWFQKKEIMPARGVDELEELFYWCTANNNILIINVPPDQTGQIRKNEADTILALADRLGIRGGESKLPKGPKNLTFNKNIDATSANPKHPASFANDYSVETAWITDNPQSSVTIDFQKKIKFNKISLFEYFSTKDLGDGFSIQHIFGTQAFSIEAFDGKKWTVIHSGNDIGACKIVRFPHMKASKLKVNILKSNGKTGFFHIGVYQDSANIVGK